MFAFNKYKFMTGGVGFSTDGTNSIQNNRKLRKREHQFRNEMNLGSHLNSEEQNKEVRAEINKRKKRNQRRLLLVLISLTIISIGLVYFFIH
jgi:hypothetical protein